MNYYNEFDPKAAAWLRELIKQGLIPRGDVDTRSITDVTANDLLGYTQCHFFAGIGGWSLALQLAGWPEDKPVWTGSCPCQPFSNAGKQLGKRDERHLWPVFRELIRKRRPSTVFGEQVASKLGREWLAGVFANLEGMDYAVAGADLCAAGVGAPHIRQRLFWVADAEGEGPSRRREGKIFDEPRGCKQLGGVGVTNGAGREQGQLAAEAARYWNSTEPDGATRRMGNAHSPRLREQCGPVAVSLELAAAELRGDACDCRLGNTEGHEQRGEREPRSSDRRIVLAGGSGAWSNFEILPCLDGKARRVESGTFPLAHGVPGRVGLLRGYGNAIVPQVAAEFIKAFIETN